MVLNPKQQAFAREYLVDLNATQAAIRAGYSPKTAVQQGSRLLLNADIAAAVARGMDKRAEKLDISAERVLAEIASMAFWDPADMMVELTDATEAEAGEGYHIGEDGKLYGLRGPTDIRRLPEKIRRAIVGWGWDRNQNFTVKLADKSKALDQLARHLSLYNDKLDLNVTGDLAGRLRRAKERRNG
ncbi:terminase small subunit [Sphingobium sp.]|uniref:terminase small subunit n=1 Tax=Sphingobium sp. TaxID=1912891 RepID=UPI002B659DE1|nr:terminase small subunit [Sphingobium sp.]HUD91900.1 terminase small subunit [Sphingobium sp.]